MRNDIHIITSSIDRSIKFYVNELGMFELSHDFGMGNVLLKHLESSNFCILLIEEEGYKSESTRAIFSIGVEDCKSVYCSLKEVEFNSGGGIVFFEGREDSLLEYSLGKNFLMSDPDGNNFLISQWHENAL